MRRACICLALFAAASGAVAQGPPGADTLSARAVSESLAVLKTLDASLRANATDAAAWHRQGMIAWALADRADATPPLKNLDAAKLRRLADNSLRSAVEHAPGNARYQLMEGKFLITSEGTGARAASYGYIERAVALARKTGDLPAFAQAAVEAGRIYWRRYDAVAFQAIGDDTSSATIAEAEAAGKGNPMTTAYNETRNEGQPISEMGGSYYEQAEALFRDAYNAAPSDVRIFRQFAMLLAERFRWTELRIVARDRVQRIPHDTWGWLALGLALHRSHDSPAAVAAFDSALASLPLGERQHFFGLQRVMKPSDTAAFLRATAAARDARADQFWIQADPLWSQEGNDARTEFLARVTYAELRWTVDEMGLHGADSDRGELYVRYGPPDVITTHGPNAAKTDIGKAGFELHPDTAVRGPAPRSQLFIVTKWIYNNGFVFFFWGMPSYATAHIPIEDLRRIAEMEEGHPFDFWNVATGRVYLMPTLTARFRAPGDSVDLVIATQAPMQAIRTAGAANVSVRADLWMFGRNNADGLRDSAMFDASGVEVWTRRLPPMNYMFRIEATSDGVPAAGQVMRWIEAGPDSTTGFTTRGFGLSDILLATNATARQGNPSRWRDFSVAPLLGALPRNSSVELIWENYELGARDGAARYQVAITLQRDRSAAGRIAAEIVGAVAGAVGVARRDDRIVLTFDRTAPIATSLVDHVTMKLGDTPAGRYRLIVQVTDRITGRTTSRTSTLTIGS